MFHIFNDRGSVTGRDIRRAHAQRRIGNDHPYATLLGPIVWKLCLTVVAVAVIHRVGEIVGVLAIASGFAVVGAALTALWFARSSSGMTARARIAARASGAPVKASARTHALGVVGLAFLAVAYFIWPS